MAYFLSDHRKASALETAAWAANVLFLAIGIATTAALTASFAFPYLHTLLSSILPKLQNSAISWLAPPYLFITVHFIIMVIWKLHRDQMPEDIDQTPPLICESSPIIPDLSADSLVDQLEVPEKPIENHSESEPSSSSNMVARSEARNVQRPQPPPDTDPEEINLGMGYELSPTPDSIDATWKAIMEGKSSPVNTQLEKSDTWEKTSNIAQAMPPWPTTLARAAAVDRHEFRKSDTFSQPKTSTSAGAKKEMRKSKTFKESTTTISTVGWRGRDFLDVGRDELHGKFEAFIKMNYDQMRLQRQESEQRYAEMANAAAC